MSFAQLGDDECLELINALIFFQNAWSSLVGADMFAFHVEIGTIVMVSHIDLSNNFIGDVGAAKIADALKSGLPLAEVDLSETGVSDEGVMRLAEAIKSDNCSLRELTLTGTDITKEGFDALAESMKGNATLNLHVDECEESEELIEILRERHERLISEHSSSENVASDSSNNC